nr:hypothetical protein [uncultured Undibacterium sp.]
MRYLSLATILSFSAMTLMITSNVAFADIKNTHTTLQKELRIGSKSDILTMDPHVIAESLQLDVLGNIYEPLVGQDSSGKLTPILAKYWKQLSPTRWRFHLREGVHFEQGEAFDADVY